MKAACDLAIAAFPPDTDKSGKVVQTHCNEAARAIAHALGCLELDDPALCADDMIAIMEKNVSGKWKKVEARAAALQALNNELAFAALSSKALNEQHGHIAALYPQGMQFSGSLGRDVPVVANIGKTMGVMRATQAFPPSIGEPAYYTWG